MNLILKESKRDLIVLDDAFQHRAIKSGLNIILTPYNDLFSRDFVLPAGNLREFRSGKKRADAVIVTKCPKDLSKSDKEKVINSINFHNSNVFFSSIKYDELIQVSGDSVSSIENVLLVTGIANPAPLVKHWSSKASVELLRFKDHHNFTTGDIQAIREKFDSFADRNKVIVTTEKDWMRLQSYKNVLDASIPLHYQPITVEFSTEKTFKSFIDEYYDQI